MRDHVGHSLLSRFVTRLRVRRSSLAPAPRGFSLLPEPRTTGDLQRAADLVRGHIKSGGHHLDVKTGTPWATPAPFGAFAMYLHGFHWLDDLAASGDYTAHRQLQLWTFEWLKTYRTGHAMPWDIQSAANRLIRLLHHGPLLLVGARTRDEKALWASFGQHIWYLSRYADRGGQASSTGLIGLCAALYAALHLRGTEHHIARLMRAVSTRCDADIDAQNGIASRNPEQLLNIFALLCWISNVCNQREYPTDQRIVNAMEKIVPLLRALRHSDGSLARFHGGAQGAAGLLDQTLALVHKRRFEKRDSYMGYTRIHAGAATLVADIAAPPAFKTDAYRSLGAFELSNKRGPLVVNCGAPTYMAQEWQQAFIGAAAHSGLSLDPPLDDAPKNVTFATHKNLQGDCFSLNYEQAGLSHNRTLGLSYDGKTLTGADKVEIARNTRTNVQSHLRFHLHPSCTAVLEQSHVLIMQTGASRPWVFRYNGAAHIALEESLYLSTDVPHPQETQQIVLHWPFVDQRNLIEWSIGKE